MVFDDDPKNINVEKENISLFPSENLKDSTERVFSQILYSACRGSVFVQKINKYCESTFFLFRWTEVFEPLNNIRKGFQFAT
jgi:hypothetical protein